MSFLPEKNISVEFRIEKMEKGAPIWGHFQPSDSDKPWFLIVYEWLQDIYTVW